MNELPHEIYLEIFQYIPELNYKLRLLNLQFSKCKFLYDDWDVLIAIGYTVEITRTLTIWRKNNKLHSPYYNGEVLPALTWANGSKEWYKYGKIHRDPPSCHGKDYRLGDGEDLPASICATGVRRWYRYGKLHRDNDLPAAIYAGGTLCWYKKGMRHRDSRSYHGEVLPAIIHPNGSQEWYKNGQLHRDNDLPAQIWDSGEQRWYKNGKPYTPKLYQM